MSFYHFLFLQPKKFHLRRRRPDDSTDYVCPIESSSPQSGQSAVNGVQVRPYAGFRGLSPILDRESDRPRDQVGLGDSRADPSVWQLWWQHDETVLSRFSSANQLVTAATLLPLLAAHNTSAHPFPAPLNPPPISPTLCLTSLEIQRSPDKPAWLFHSPSCLSWRAHWGDESTHLKYFVFLLQSDA